MACCSGRCVLITLCSLQLILSVEHQVFCFLGYLWGAIIANFIQIIMVIIGLFGACQYRPRVVTAYAIWLLLWLAIGIFVICLYLKIGLLTDLDGIHVLSIGTRSDSWWELYGIGCGTLQGCLIAWQYVEIIHTGLQCLLCIISFIVACYVIYVFMEEDDSFDFIGGFDPFTPGFNSPEKNVAQMQLQPVYVSIYSFKSRNRSTQHSDRLH